MSSNQAAATDNICKRKKCTFYGSVRNGTCNYRLITGSGRGMSIADCLHFTTEPFEDRRKRININPPTKNPVSQKPKGAKKDMPKTHDWITIMAELSAGDSYDSVKAKHGFSDSAYHYQMRKKNAPQPTLPKEGGKRAEGALDGFDKVITLKAGKTQDGAGKRAERPSKDPRTGISKNRWYSQDLMRIADIADTLTETANAAMYRSYSLLMESIVTDMIERRIKEVGAEEGAADEH